MAVYDVDTGGGGSYSSLNAAEAALPATPTEADTITCTGTTADTAAVLVNNDRSTYGLTISGDGAEAEWNTSLYRLSISGLYDPAIDIGSVNITVEDIQAECTAGHTDSPALNCGWLLYPTVSRCYFWKNAPAGWNGYDGASAIHVSQGGTFENVIVRITHPAGGRGIGSASSTCRNYIARNCTAITEGADTGEDGTGFFTDGSATYVLVTNCLSIADVAYSATFDSASDYNIGSDTTAPGANSIDNGVGAELFTDYSGGDYSLKSGSDAIDAGDDLSAYFTDDIVGTTRPQNSIYDIGAFEYVATGGQSITVNQASETDTAGSITPSTGAITVTVNQASETDTAGTVAVSVGAVTVSVSQANETDTAGFVYTASATIKAEANVFRSEERR